MIQSTKTKLMEKGLLIQSNCPLNNWNHFLIVVTMKYRFYQQKRSWKSGVQLAERSTKEWWVKHGEYVIVIDLNRFFES